jgi:endonuclease YncB( thermonuclease family)
LGLKETHRAAEDVAIHEAYVLRRGAAMTQALQDVSERTPAGMKLVGQARRGQGLLSQAANFMARLESIAPELQSHYLAERFARAEQDLYEFGSTVHQTGPERLVGMRQMSPGGEEKIVPRLQYAREEFHSMEGLLGHLRGQSQYSQFGVNVDEQYRAFTNSLADLDGAARIRATEDYVWASRQRVGQLIGPGILDVKSTRLAGAIGRAEGGGVVGGVMDALGAARRQPRAAMAVGAVVGGVALLGALLGSRAGSTPPQSLLSYNYEEWLGRQQGLATQGEAKKGRPHFTDFASPYRGPVTSSKVLANQELLQEREKWMRQQYGAVHYDPVHGLFGLAGIFKSTAGRSYSYLRGGTPVAASHYQGMRGGNLLALNLADGDWKMSVDDADTVTVKKGGVRGALASMFGLNRGYSFRLAGIDAPETSHGSSSYHAPQPYAEAAKEALKSLIAGSRNLELVYDPTEMTYGRMLGAVVADGKNVNFEIARRGLAAHLPYGRPQDAIIDYRALAKTEERAAVAGRGMWSTPWAQTFRKMMGAADYRVTFNTLARTDSIVSNAGNMGLLTMMEYSQEQGQVPGWMDGAAADFGATYNRGRDNVRPTIFEQRHHPHQNHMLELQTDLGKLIRTHGTNRNMKKLSRKSGYGSHDKTLVLDGLGTTNTIWADRSYSSFDVYGIKQHTRNKNRKRGMALAQRHAVGNMFTSPIGHHRM